MTRRTVRISGTGHPLLDIHSFGRAGPQSRPFTATEIQQIARTVRQTPEVMLKVTGGGAKVGTVAAHLGYISRNGDLGIETDDGERIRNRDEQNATSERLAFGADSRSLQEAVHERSRAPEGQTGSQHRGVDALADPAG